jgi:hypothetical protein
VSPPNQVEMSSSGRRTWSELLRDPLVLLVLAIVLLLEFGAWRATEGYRLADSVEFMERARALERGEAMVDSVAIRPFGFSTLLVPFFALSSWIGLPEGRAVAWAISLLQVGLGLGLAAVAIRLGSALGGRRTGLLAGLLAGANPVFLQYSSQPVSGLAAGIFAGLALDAVLDGDGRDGFRPGLRSGLWLGAAFLTAFQSLLIAVAVALLLAVRDGIRGRTLLPASVRGLACGLGVAVLVQVLIDWVSFGTPGASLANYLVQNFGSVVTSFLARVGLKSLAASFYKLVLAAQGHEVVIAEHVPLAAKQHPWFYLLELPRMLVWPALFTFALGLARGIVRPSWKIALPALALLANVLAMSHKGSKDFRLWLPLLPWIAALAAYGWTWLPLRGKSSAALDLAFAGSLLVLGPIALAPGGARRFAGFWRAMDWIDERARTIAAERTGEDRRARVACTYHWSVFLRETAEVRLEKLPWQLDGWAKLDAKQRDEDLAALDRLDLFAAHLPLLAGNGDLVEFLSSRFHVVAAVYDPEIDLSGFGPILVLERRAGAATENLLFETTEASPGTAPALVRFGGSTADGGREVLELSNWGYARLPPQGLGWIRCSWTTPTGLSRDFVVENRITCPEDAFGWQHNGAPAWDLRPTSAWKPGETVTEGYLVVPAHDPYAVGKPMRPLGEEFRAQGRAPAGFWLHVATAEHAALVPEGGLGTSADGFVRVARFDLPLIDAPR